MGSASRRVTAGICGLVWIGVAQLSAQDWPQWRGANRDGKVSGFTAPETWPTALKEVWKKTVGLGCSTPALVGDKLYVFVRQGEDEVTLCMNAEGGGEVWKSQYAAQAVSGAANRHPGPRSSPAVAEGKVVTLGVGGVLSCLDAATGKQVWKNEEYSKVVPQFFTASSPIIVDGLCIAQLGGRGNGAILALDLATGAPKWKWTGDSPAYASPVVMTVDGAKHLVAQNEKSLVGIAVADGKLLWQVPTPVEGRVYNSATPLVDGQTLMYTGQGKGTRAAKVEKQGDGFALKDLWTSDKAGTGYNTPVLKDGYLYGFSTGGNFWCLDAKTGQEAWTDGASRDRSGFGSIVDAGAALVALPSSSELTVFKPSAKGYEELARIKVSAEATYAHPVLAGKRIYVKDKETLTAWTVE